MPNEIKIRQPYDGDRGRLVITVEAKDLPAAAYAALEDVMSAAEVWARNWLPVTQTTRGSIPWFEVTLEQSTIPTRVKTQLIRLYHRDTPIRQVLVDLADGNDGVLDFQELTQYHGIGGSSVSSLDAWVKLQERESGLHRDEALEYENGG